MDTAVKPTSLTVAVTGIEKVEGEIAGEIAVANQHIDTLKIAAESIVVDGPEAEARATQIAVEAKTLNKALEAKREQTAGILGTWARKLNAQFKPSSDMLDAVVATLGRKVGAYKNALEMARQADIRANAEKIAAEEKRLEAEKAEAAKKYLAKKQVAEAFDAPEMATAAAVEYQETMAKTNVFVPEVVEKRTVVAGGSASVKPKWDYEIIDENLIPRQYMMPNESKIKAAIKAEVDIPGIRRFQVMGFGRVNTKKIGG